MSPKYVRSRCLGVDVRVFPNGIIMLKSRLVEYESAAYVTGLPHRVFQPEGQGPHPTIVMLHGRHGTEEVTWIFTRALPENWLLVAPRGIENEPEKPGDVGYSWIHHPETGWPDLAVFQPAVTAVYDFITALPDVYTADPRRIYLLGFSQGAATAYALAMKHPELVQGIAGLVGFAPEPPEELFAQRVLDGMPVFTAVGERDERVPLAVARRGAEILRRAGADLTYREYKTGHRLNSAGMKDLAAWWEARNGA